MTDTAVVRAGSHRARQKLQRIGLADNALYSFRRFATGGFFRIPTDRLDDARAITGVTQTRDDGDLLPCWTTRVLR